MNWVKWRGAGWIKHVEGIAGINMRCHDSMAILKRMEEHVWQNRDHSSSSIERKLKECLNDCRRGLKNVQWEEQWRCCKQKPRNDRKEWMKISRHSK